FGKDGEKGLRLNTQTLALEAVVIGDNGVSEADILVHDETNKMIATLLAHMEPPAMPVALGVLYCAPGQSYDDEVGELIRSHMPSEKPDFNKLLRAGRTWTVD
ncbi:MAG: 2-oxoacid:ferredoxin oxidoreductase subunit beta, partial [Rhodospirillales bacterium]